MMFSDIDVFLSYSSALHTSLARVQGLSLIVTTYTSIALKSNGMAEDIFFYFLLVKKKLYPVKKDPYSCLQFFCLFFDSFRNTPVPPS